MDRKGNVTQLVRPLKEDTIMAGIKFPNGTNVCLDEFGERPFWWAELQEDYEIQGIKFPKETSIYNTYESGKLESLWLSQDTEIQGIKCDKGKIQFHKSGKLEYVRLSVD